jgi:hypothetical protein
LPPPEIRKWLRSPPPISPSSFVEEARRGNPDLLIAHLRTGSAPTPVEIELFIELLEAKRGRRYHDKLHRIEQYLIAVQVHELTKELGKQEAAIRKVMELRGCKRRKVFAALKAHAEGRLSSIHV